MNCTELAKEILLEVETNIGAKNKKAAEQFLAKKLRSIFDSGLSRSGDDGLMAVYLDCGTPKAIYVNKRDMLEMRVVFLDDPSLLDDDKIDTSAYYGDSVVVGMLRPEMLYNARELADFIDSV